MPLRDPEALKIIPLGGLGEIGLNMMVLECHNRILLIDCGLMFPDEDMFGVDIVIPDFKYLEGRSSDIEALILTHGHDDHIGAVPYFLRHHQPLVIGSELTLSLLESHLQDHKLNGSLRKQVVGSRSKLSLGPFTVEFLPVTHSIVGGFALGIETSQGLIVHSGDFKLDHNPFEGEMTDLKKLAEYGEHGVTCLMADSTNVEREGYTISEREIALELQNIFLGCKGRILVSLFASNQQRIQQIFDIARRFNRRVVLNGKSIVDNVSITRRLGLLKIEDRQLVDLNNMEAMNKENLVILCTGSQGEPLSVLSRISAGSHKQIKIEKGDTVILSSKSIPGNERAVTHLINELYRQGAEVIYEGISKIHTSGHAYQEELKLLLKLTRPTHFIPIHGEYRHLVQHARLAQTMGVGEDCTMVLENGDVVAFSQKKGSVCGRVHSSRIYVDGQGVGDVGNIVLTDRRILSEDGIITCAIAHRDWAVVSGPHFKSKGLVYEPEQQDLLEEAKFVVEEIMMELHAKQNVQVDDAKEEIARSVRRLFSKRIGRRPIVIPVLMEV